MKKNQKVEIREYYENGILVKRTANGFSISIADQKVQPDKDKFVTYYSSTEDLKNFYAKKGVEVADSF